MTELTVERLGHLGDGLARVAGRALVVPGGLPGERYLEQGDRFERLASSPARQDPPCQHFGDCGGCNLQHIKTEPYLEFKTDLVRDALKKAKLPQTVINTVKACRPCPPSSRRRISFSAKLGEKGAQIGLLSRGSHAFVPIEACLIAHGSIVDAMDDLRDVAAQLLRGHSMISLSVTVCDNGLDIAVTAEQDPSTDMLAALVRTVARTPFLRVSVNGDIVFEQAKPVVHFGSGTVSPPPGGFLQAVSSVEADMRDMVVTHLARSKNIADLFCGSGTFTVPLAKMAQTTGFESDTNAVGALSGLGQPPGHKTLKVVHRDLFETPLSARELRLFDGVCLDPPRAGAKAQCEQLAKSDVARIAYVSCNPGSFAEDASVLAKAGYTIKVVQPFDQFLYAPHVELMALFEKTGSAKRRRIF